MSQSVGAIKGVRAASDFLGIGLSVLCLIHCLTFPILIAFAPVLLKELPGDDVTHRTLAIAIGFVGFLAFRSGYKVHRRRWLLYLFCLGLLLVTLAAALGEAVLTNYGESGITVCGGLLLVTAHLFNRSFCRSCAVHVCRHSFPSVGADVPQVKAGPGGYDSR